MHLARYIILVYTAKSLKKGVRSDLEHTACLEGLPHHRNAYSIIISLCVLLQHPPHAKILLTRIILSITRIDKADVAIMITFVCRRYRVLISAGKLTIVTGAVRGFLHSFQKSAITTLLIKSFATRRSPTIL